MDCSMVDNPLFMNSQLEAAGIGFQQTRRTAGEPGWLLMMPIREIFNLF